MRTFSTPRRMKSSKRYPTEGCATVEEAMEFLNCRSKQTIYNMVDAKKLRRVPLMVEMRIPWSSLWQHVEGRESVAS